MLKFHTYSSPESAFFVNSFVVESASGLLVIDTQFLVSSARALGQMIESLQKPLLGVVITHPHPDHFNGTAHILGDKAVPVFATQATLEQIRATEAEKREFWTPHHGDNYPATTILPNVVVAPGEAITVGDITLALDDLGPGESADITVAWFEAEQTLIASDLLYHRVHPWMAEGRTGAWLDQIDLVTRRYANAQTVLAGHGAPGTLEDLGGQADYITHFRNLISDRLGASGTLGEQDHDEIRQVMLDRYTQWPLEFLIDFNIPAVGAEIAALA